MTRIKVTVPELTLDDVARISGEISEAARALEIDTAAQNAQLDAVRAAHQDIQQTLSDEVRAKTDQLERWASAHPELFEKARSMDLPRAVIGFRTGQPTVKTVKGMAVPEVIEALLRRGHELFVKLGRPSLDKEAIIRERDAMADEFAKCGVQIVQEERFFIDPKRDDPHAVPS